jgi:hypothetical protein
MYFPLALNNVRAIARSKSGYLPNIDHLSVSYTRMDADNPSARRFRRTISTVLDFLLSAVPPKE